MQTATPDSVQLGLAKFRTMVEIRRFEDRVYRLFNQGLVRASTHLSLGHEAISAGFGHAMKRGDYTFATYRGHGHAIARGVAFGPLLAEIMGRSNGLMRGKGGSLHIASVIDGMMGSFGIVGSHLTIANGAAWSSQLQEDGRVTVCFFGDGATNIGAFHEALNLAAVWRLPIVFVCENNLYMEYTPIADVIPVEHPAADRAASYGLDRIVVDGNDVDDVYELAMTSIDRARRGDGPVLVEALTYRHAGHSRGDPAKYRPEEEVAAWMARDPVPAYRAKLETDLGSEIRLDEIEEEVSAAVEEAVEIALAGELPDETVLMQDVWSDGGSSWRN